MTWMVAGYLTVSLVGFFWTLAKAQPLEERLTYEMPTSMSTIVPRVS